MREKGDAYTVWHIYLVILFKVLGEKCDEMGVVTLWTGLDATRALRKTAVYFYTLHLMTAIRQPSLHG